MNKITNLSELEVGKVVYFHNTTTGCVTKALILEEIQYKLSMGGSYTTHKVFTLDLDTGRKAHLYAEDFNIIPNVYNSHFASFEKYEISKSMRMCPTIVSQWRKYRNLR